MATKNKAKLVAASKTTAKPLRVRKRLLRGTKIRRMRSKSSTHSENDGWPAAGNANSTAGMLSYLADIDWVKEIRKSRDEWER